MDAQLRFEGLVVAPDVVETIVRLAAEKVEGVASVGVPADLNSMLRFFSPRRATPSLPAVTASTSEQGLTVGVRLTAFFGYPFSSLADEVRAAVAASVSSQLGVAVACVDVYVDALVYPKE